MRCLDAIGDFTGHSREIIRLAPTCFSKNIPQKIYGKVRNGSRAVVAIHVREKGNLGPRMESIIKSHPKPDIWP